MITDKLRLISSLSGIFLFVKASTNIPAIASV